MSTDQQEPGNKHSNTINTSNLVSVVHKTFIVIKPVKDRENTNGADVR